MKKNATKTKPPHAAAWAEGLTCGDCGHEIQAGSCGCLPAEAPPPEIAQERATKHGEQARIVYAWPSRSACPRCGSLNTERTSAYKSTQYRRCRVAVCRKRYAVQGRPPA